MPSTAAVAIDEVSLVLNPRAFGTKSSAPATTPVS
jgi:hypothetical protein